MKPKIIVIVGPTASGKTSLSIQLALAHSGEVISADSRQVYKGLDLGTGKVTKEEMQGIPHHLLDRANPNDIYSVTNFVRDSRKVIDEVISRENTSIIVGGTFFYIDALLGRVTAPEVPPNESLRAMFEQYSNEDLHALIQTKDPARAHTIDTKNKRRLIRALEIIEAIGAVPQTQNENLYNALTLGISTTKEELKDNIHIRLMARIENGMIDEVVNLHNNGLTYERMYELGIEYKYIALYLEEKITKEEMLTQIETKSLQYAKRQMTWLKRDKDIHWVDKNNSEHINKLVADFLV